MSGESPAYSRCKCCPRKLSVEVLNTRGTSRGVWIDCWTHPCWSCVHKLFSQKKLRTLVVIANVRLLLSRQQTSNTSARPPRVEQVGCTLRVSGDLLPMPRSAFARSTEIVADPFRQRSSTCVGRQAAPLIYHG